MPKSDPGDGETSDDELLDVTLTDAEIDYLKTDGGPLPPEHSRQPEYDEILSVFEEVRTWKKVVDGTPVPDKLDPKRLTEIHQLAEYMRKGTYVSATEDAAAQIRALASSQNVPTQVLDEAYQRLSAFQGEVLAAAGENSVHQQTLLASVQQAQAAVEAAIGACTQLLDDIHTAADGHARG